MTPEMLARHLAHDLRISSIHEAAHAVIARRYGAQACAYVFPTNTSDPVANKTFVGRVHYTKLDEYETRMVCLAGTVAEACDGDPDVDGINLMDWIESEVFILSATDAAGAGDYTEADLDECISLVRAGWDEIEVEAQRLAAQAKEWA